MNVVQMPPKAEQANFTIRGEIAQTEIEGELFCGLIDIYIDDTVILLDQVVEGESTEINLTHNQANQLVKHLRAKGLHGE